MDLDVAGIYARMESVWKVKGYAALGEKLGGKPPGTIASRKYQKSVPLEYILRTMLGTGCREEWLLTGQGPIYRDSVFVADLTAPVQAAVRSMMGASTYAQEVMERVAGLLATDHMGVIDAIINGAIAAEHKRRAAEAMQADVPDDPEA